MIIIELKGSEKPEFGEALVSVDESTLKVRAKYQDRQDVVDTYPLVNVIRYRNVPDVESNT